MNHPLRSNMFLAGSTASGTLAGMYQFLIGSTLWHTILTTAITAAVSCLVSFSVQQILRKFRR